MAITELRPAAVSVRPRGLPGPPGRAGRDGTDGLDGHDGLPGDALHFATVALARLATVSVLQQFFSVAGYALVGDGGEAIYGRVAIPSTAKSYHVQTADGAWWAPTQRVINLAAWNCPMDGSDAYQAVQDALDKIGADGGGAIFHPGGTVLNGSQLRWKVPSDILIFGIGGDRSLFKANGMTVPMFQSAGGTGGAAVRTYRQHIRDFAISNTVGPAAAGFIAWDWRNESLGSHTNINIYDVDVGMQFAADAGLGCYYNEGNNSRVNNSNIAFDALAGANENSTYSCSANGANIGLRESDTSHNVHFKFEAAVCATTNVQINGATYDCNLLSPRIENTSLSGVGISIVSTAVNTVIENPQYTLITTPLNNSSLSTKVNGLRSFRFTVDRGSLSAQSTDDYAVSLPGFARDADAVQITPGYTLPGGLIMQAVPGSAQVYSRTANVTANPIDPPSMTHLLTWWKPGGD